MFHVILDAGEILLGAISVKCFYYFHVQAENRAMPTTVSVEADVMPYLEADMEQTYNDTGKLITYYLTGITLYSLSTQYS